MNGIFLLSSKTDSGTFFSLIAPQRAMRSPVGRSFETMKTDGDLLSIEDDAARVSRIVCPTPWSTKTPAVLSMLMKSLPTLCLAISPLLLALIRGGNGTEPSAILQPAHAERVSGSDKFLPIATTCSSRVPVQASARIVGAQPHCGVRTDDLLASDALTVTAQRCHERPVKRGPRLNGGLHLNRDGTLILSPLQSGSPVSRPLPPQLGSCLYVFMSLQR